MSKTETRGITDREFSYPDVTRVEVIDHRHGTVLPARAFIADQRGQPPFTVELSWQDDGRTLKVLLSDAERKAEED